MSSQKRSTVVFGIIFAAAVIFFIAIILAASVFDDSGSDVKTVDNGMTITEMRVETVWRNDRSCRVKQELDVRFESARHGIYVDIPVNSGERVRDLNVNVRDDNGGSVPYELRHESGNRIVRVKVGDADKYFSAGSLMYCSLDYDYITPLHPDGKDILDINPVGYGWACFIENAEVSVTFPKSGFADSLQVWVSGDRFDDYTVSADGKTVYFSTDRLVPYNGVRVKAKMPSGVLVGRSDTENLWTVAVGVALVAAVILLMVFVGKDKPVTPIVSFYPPYTDGNKGRKRRMLPVQVGTIIDGKCSSSDVTSLIFYWASEGYLAIEEDDIDTYLVKLKDIDPVTEYERELFNKLFDKAKTNKETGEKKVGVKDLTGSFADKIAAARIGASKEYRGTFYKKGYTVLSALFAVAVALFGVLTAVLVTLRIGDGFFNPIGMIVAIPIIIAYALGSVIVRVYLKLGKTQRSVYLVMFFAAIILLSIAVMLAVPTDCMSWTVKIIFAVCIAVASAFSPFLTRRTDSYTERLNDILGFRDFLRDAEKDRLEELIADDPQYFYNILPYANVLGVSKVWQDKFAGLDIQPPAYYRGNNVSLFDIYVISRLSNSIGSSLTYSPPKASGGSFSGGRSGGGGGSFGGFGGGGGGSW